MSWCTIESDPGVFNEMLWSLGVKEAAVEEIYSLEEAEQARDKKSYGLIFLYKWRQEVDSRPTMSDEDAGGLMFAKQIVQNACATQAILSVILNTSELQLGEQLSEFKNFVGLLDSESRGIAIGNSDLLRNVHNSFARPEPFLTEETKSKLAAKEDVHHFIAYVPYAGVVYELDGLKAGPILINAIDDRQDGSASDWLAVARPAIEERIARYTAQAANETSFALLSICPRRSVQLEREVARLQTAIQAATATGQTDIGQLQNELLSIQSQLSDERHVEEQQRQENIRRRHNYLPFLLCLLQQLAKKNLLPGMIQRAKDKQAATRGGGAGAVKRKLDF